MAFAGSPCLALLLLLLPSGLADNATQPQRQLGAWPAAQPAPAQAPTSTSTRYVKTSANIPAGPTAAGTIVEAAPRTRALRPAGHASALSGWSKWGTHSSTAWATSTQAALP